MINWLMNLPCVVNRIVVIDTRGPWPVAIIGLRARQIESREDMVMFVMENL